MTREQFANNLRVIQIHPSLQCNLACKHCYSSSAPVYKTHLAADDIIRFLQYAKGYGFEILSVSGGEPFMYPELEKLLSASHDMGNKNITVSNAMLLKSERAKRILNHLDLIAISIDGDEAAHDEMRNFNGAFEKMKEGVKVLHDNDVKFGFIHTVTETSWQKLLWLAEFANDNGARLLQLHPLELTGRAKLNFKHLIPSQDTLHKTFIIGKYLEDKYNNKMQVQMDFLHKLHIIQNPESVNFFGDDYDLHVSNFSNVIKCLIVDENGDIYPMSYGFSKDFCIGNIKDTSNGKDVIKHFIKRKGTRLYNLIAETFSMIKNNVETDLFVWTELIVKNSYSPEVVI